MERKWVVVAFGDILGFMSWSKRASTTPEIRDPFTKEFYAEMGKLSKNDTYVKYLGDGFMMIQEIDIKEIPVNFLESIIFFTNKMGWLIKTCRWPRPQGFRSRIVAGYVDKIEVNDPQDSQRKVPEYVGYAINLAQRLLEIQPSNPLICHESVLQLHGEKKSKFKFKKLENITERPRGVDSDDLAGLWSIRL